MIAADSHILAYSRRKLKPSLFKFFTRELRNGCRIKRSD